MIRSKLAPAGPVGGSSDPLGGGLLGGTELSGNVHGGSSVGGRDLRRQVELLMRKQFILKRRAWKWTLLEIFFPLQPIFFLWLVFTLGGDFLPYEKEVTQVTSSFTPVNLLNNSAAGLAVAMHIGGSIGFAPVSTSADDHAAAAALHSLFCGGYDGVLGAPQYGDVVQQFEAQADEAASAACAADSGSMQCRMMGAASEATYSPGRCQWFASPADLDAAGGWFPFAGGGGGMDFGAPGAAQQGMYIGAVVGAHSLLIRNEDLILVDDANGDPEEQNTLRTGLLAFQWGASLALLANDRCPSQMAMCGQACFAQLVGIAASGQLQACGSGVACVLGLLTEFPPAADSVPLLYCLQSASNEGELMRTLRLANPLGLFMEQFPVAGSIKLINMRKFMYPFMFLTVLFLNVQATLTLLGEEKEKGIKDALSLKGMQRAAFYGTWFLSQSAVMTASCFVVTVAARACSIIVHTGMVHFGLVLWVYGCCLIAMSFLIASCE